jgi:CheY-like chemotaxis protein
MNHLSGLNVMAKKKIMVVDDEETLVELARAILENDFEVISANSGKECLEKLKRVKPEIILMDMFMPEMSGRETTERIRANPKTKDIKIIFLTVARFSETGKDILKKMKVSDYITKPFENDDLLRRVKKAIKS